MEMPATERVVAKSLRCPLRSRAASTAEMARWPNAETLRGLSIPSRAFDTLALGNNRTPRAKRPAKTPKAPSHSGAEEMDVESDREVTEGAVVADAAVVTGDVSAVGAVVATSVVSTVLLGTVLPGALTVGTSAARRLTTRA